MPLLGDSQENFLRQIKERESAIRAKYGENLNAETVRRIMQIEREIEPCSRCEGAECLKSVAKYAQYEITKTEGGVKIEVKPNCVYRLQQLRMKK